MAAGDQKFIKNHFKKELKKKGRERNVNNKQLKNI